MAELLDAPSRNWISAAFKAPIFDFYGAHELGLVAWECEEKAGYHVNIDSIVVEFLWNGKPVPSDQEGKLVCTALNSYAMPFIRYEIGDVGVRSDEPCRCGRGLPLMKILEGRFVDFVVLPGGRRVSPYLLTCSIEEIRGIAKYQILQERQDRIVIRLVKGRGFSPEIFLKIRRRLESVVGEEVEIEFEVLDDIPREGQKDQVVLSRVSGG
jgi:phenylacetate-CoA ligase